MVQTNKQRNNLWDAYLFIFCFFFYCELRFAESLLHFPLVGFYGISSIVGYSMPNPLYTYISNIYNLVWLGFMAYQPL